MQERLQKLIASAGLTSRRKAEELILQGDVTVNGKIIMELGVKADPNSDHIKVKGKLINPILDKKENVYFLLNKPKGFLSSLSDPENRPLVTQFLPINAPRVNPVGRLDFNTEGLLILTNDGELLNLITRAGSHCPKVYHVKVKGLPRFEQIDRLRRGLKIEERTYRIANIVNLNSDDGVNAWYEVTLHEGKNNQIRRMFDEIGHSVVKLRRVAIGHLTDRGLPIGEVRTLTPAEVRRFFYASKKKNKLTSSTSKLGKPKPQGQAKKEQARRLAKTIGKSLAAKSREKARAKMEKEK